MAAASPSPLASSVEKTNGAKLSRLLIDGGTTVLRNAFDGYHPPANLSVSLKANKVVLKDLLKKKVLRAAQWDQLFPPGGAAPDSNTFDVTLLFLLLTNICGLSPPLSGWHAKPSRSDISLEANLARVKFFRNVLYGHVSTTSIDTPTFCSLWQEISDVLVALGLDQVEIDKLKVENCGEEDYLSVLVEWARCEEDIKSQMTDIHHSLIKTQHSIEKVHHTQINTQQALETSVQDTSLMVRKGLQIQEECYQTLQELKPTVEQRRKDEEDKILKRLAKIDQENDVKNHAERYQEGTRISILTKLENWLDDRSSQNRVMVISGNAGMGKSVISAVVCERMQETGRLSGSHFCQHGKARHRNPKVMLQSLACQLSDSLPEYKSAIVDILSRNLGEDLNNMEVSDLFELLFEKSLCRVKNPGRNILMVIDGLDESEYHGRNELLEVIARHFRKLPCWIRFLVTTRPEISIEANLRVLNPLKLAPNNEENLHDIRVYFKERLGHVIESEYGEMMLDTLVEKSEGVILFAYFLVDFIRNRNLSLVTPEMLNTSLPSGLSDVYKSYFKRLEGELYKEINITEEQFFKVLCSLTSAREPLPIGFLSKLIMSDTVSSVGQRKVKRAIACISTLLPVEDDCIRFFHKSVKDWLTEASSYGQHDFTVDLKEGHGILSELCRVELDDVKLNGVVNGQFTDTKTYALQHGVAHMLEDARSYDRKEIVTKFVLDLTLVYAKLCLNHATAAEDIVRCQKQNISSVLPEESTIHLDNLLLLLRKYHDLLKHHPKVFLQTVLNEGEAELSSEASCLLREKHSNITFMEYIHKDVHEEAPLATFPCSAAVICFDVSTQSDYMVCECKDELLYMWSLLTGKLEWKRPVKVEKQYLSDRMAYRTSPSSNVCSCYRSVVFHPVKDVVLPGILSSAYAFDGDLKPLFPESNCTFTVCSISNAGGEATILTNSPDDPKRITLWSLDNGSQVANIHGDEDVISFACSLDGRMLAMSHPSGSICLVDLKGLRTLTKVKIPRACGMMKFSSNHQFLYCWHEPCPRDESNHRNNVYLLKVERCGNDGISLGVCKESVSYKPYEHESASKAGFLQGDPFSCIFEQLYYSPHILVDKAFVFVLNNQNVLRYFPEGNCVGMFSTDVLRSFTASFYQPQVSRAENIAFSINGETLYVIAKGPAGRRVMAWDVPSRENKATMVIQSTRRKCLLPVEEGVIITTDDGCPELWSFHLSNCIRRWPKVRNITDAIPLSGNQVACVGVQNKAVYVLDITSTVIAATIPFRHEGYQTTVSTLRREAITCNSKHQVLSTARHSVQLSAGTDIIWRRPWPDSVWCSYGLPGMFSPTEEFVLISAKCSESGDHDVYVLHASSGEEQRILFRCSYVFDCKFVGDEECVVDCQDFSLGSGLRLFNVKSGDLLSIIVRQQRTFCLATCPLKHLIAIDIDGSEHNFRLIKVNIPQHEDNRENEKGTRKQLGE